MKILSYNRVKGENFITVNYISEDREVRRWVNYMTCSEGVIYLVTNKNNEIHQTEEYKQLVDKLNTIMPMLAESIPEVSVQYA